MLLGQLSSTATAASISINNIKDNKNQTSNVLATLVNEGTTSSSYRNLKVSLYQRASSSTAFYPLGIYMTATGTNGRTFLDIYGGVEALSNSNNYGGFAEPNVRIGNLQGLPNVGGQTPSGWGIYTDNGYFKGIIAADRGYIGSGSKYWVIANEEDGSNAENSRSYIYNGKVSYNDTSNDGVYLGTDGIGLGKGSFYVTKAGSLYAKLGSIGGWNIDSNSFATGSWGTNNSAMLCTGTDSSKSIGGSESINNWVFTAGANFGVTKSGALYASSANISGKVVATSGSIGGVNIVDGNLDVSSIRIGSLSGASNYAQKSYVDDAVDNIEIGGRNLLKNSNVVNTSLSDSAVGGTVTQTIPSGTVITLSVQIDADDVVWKSSGNRRIGVASSITKDGGGTQYIEAWAAMTGYTSTGVDKTFDTSFHGRVKSTYTLQGELPLDKVFTLYIQNITSGTVSVSKPKLEIGNKATDWTPAPEDVDADIEEAKKVATNYLSVDSTGIMIANMSDGEQTPSTATGRNVFIDNDSVDIRDGQTTLASFSANSIQIGREVNKCHMIIQNDNINIYHANEELVHFGYGLNTGENGAENSPYYTLGTRELYGSIGSHSVVEGFDNTASNWCSYAQGYGNTASGQCAHAEGRETTASSRFAHAEGLETTASGDISHAEGVYSIASGYASHAEGSRSEASGDISHAEGARSKASGQYAHAEGLYTTAASRYQHVQGKCNIIDENDKYAFIIGNGDAYITQEKELVIERSNAFTVDWDGNVEFSGNMYCAGGNYLPFGTDIDNLTKKHSGWWVYNRSDVSGTFPISDTYGTIGHIQGTSDNVGMQFLRSNNQASTNNTLYARFKLGGTWASWQKFVSTTRTSLSITRVANDYFNATDATYPSAYKKGGFLTFRGNFHLSASMPNNTADVKVATISGWNAATSVIMCVPAQNGNATLLINISSSGDLTISNYSGVATNSQAWFRFMVTVPCADGYE